jgi:hypothetical protein
MKALLLTAWMIAPVASSAASSYSCVLRGKAGVKYETLQEIIPIANANLASRRAEIEANYREEMSKLHCDTCSEAANRLVVERNEAMAASVDGWRADLQDQCYVKGCQVICE